MLKSQRKNTLPMKESFDERHTIELLFLDKTKSIETIILVDKENKTERRQSS